MKKILTPAIGLLFILFLACNNGDKKPGEDNTFSKTQADSLEKEVEEGHNIAMPKSMRIPKLQKEVNRLIDSIGKLPAKAQEAAAPFKAKLESLLNDLGNAYSAMDKWMNEFNYDSAKDNIEQRIKYLTEEKLKVGKVKEAVLGSLQKADSLIKAKL